MKGTVATTVSLAFLATVLKHLAFRTGWPTAVSAKSAFEQRPR